MLRRREVVVTGIGLATPLGDSLDRFASALYSYTGCFESIALAHSRPIPAARVHEDTGAGLSRTESAVADRCTRLALLAATRAFDNAQMAAGGGAARCGVFVGCGTGPSESVNEAYASMHSRGRLPALALLRCLPSAAAGALAVRFGLRGPAQTFSSACASSAMAIGEAMRTVRHGYLDVALAGGTEAPFGEGTVMAWEGMRVLASVGEDANTVCRPFDRRRSGIVLGEGAVFFVLEAADHAAARGQPALAHLAGYGCSGDGHHWTEPHTRGQVQAIEAALDDARMTPGDIVAINAHGTATDVGDRVEAESIASVFGRGSQGPPASSTKAAHGHLLGASGAIELAASLVTVRSGWVPPTHNLQEPDPGCAINLVRSRPLDLRRRGAVLSNSFAFGGSNVCLVLAPS